MFGKYLLIFIVLVSYTECGNILGILHVPGRSHYQAGSTLMKIVAENGHNVTVVSPFVEKNPPKNYRNIVMTGVLDKREKTQMNLFNNQANPSIVTIKLSLKGASMVEELFNSTNFQKLMNSGEKFDLVIIEHCNSDAVKYVGHHFKAPIIVYTALQTNDWINPYQGNPDNPSYTPVSPLGYMNEMTFTQRVKNTIMYIFNQLMRIFILIPSQNDVLKKYYPSAPDLREIIDKVSLVFTNTDLSINEALPRVPSIIDIGGFHITEPKPLPNELQMILNNSTNGVIYFSLGTNLKSKDIPIEKMKSILRVFAKQKQTILWKFEDEELPGKPKNVIIQKWWPQNDIFAHKNVKLFITHGGIFSTMEAIYHGLPILALPMFGDQFINSKRATASGYAKWLDFYNLNENEFESSINELVFNHTYTDNAKIRSRIMRDKPMTPRDTINFWVDYVIRFKGADYLRVASLKLSWYQYVLLDVLAFISVVLISVFAVTIYCSKKLCRYIKIRKQSKIKDN